MTPQTNSEAAREAQIKLSAEQAVNDMKLRLSNEKELRIEKFIRNLLTTVTAEKDKEIDLLNKQVEELKADIARVRKLASEDSMAEQAKRLAAEHQIETLRKQCAAKDEALKHYANKSMWRKYPIDSHTGELDFFDWPGDLADEPWEIAEKAISPSCGNDYVRVEELNDAVRLADDIFFELSNFMALTCSKPSTLNYGALKIKLDTLKLKTTLTTQKGESGFQLSAQEQAHLNSIVEWEKQSSNSPKILGHPEGGK